MWPGQDATDGGEAAQHQDVEIGEHLTQLGLAHSRLAAVSSVAVAVGEALAEEQLDGGAADHDLLDQRQETVAEVPHHNSQAQMQPHLTQRGSLGGEAAVGEAGAEEQLDGGGAAHDLLNQRQETVVEVPQHDT